MENVNVKIPFNDTMERPFYKIKNGINPLAIDGELGYGQEAVASYHYFPPSGRGEYLPTCASKHPSRRHALLCGFVMAEETDCA